MSNLSNRDGTPGKVYTFPLTTEMGTHRSSSTNRAWSLRGRESSVGIWTMRSLAVRASEGVSQLKSALACWGLVRRRMRAKASSWSFRGRLKAWAIDW